MRSPIVREFTLGLDRDLWRKGQVRATYVWRDTTHFVEDFFDQTTGVTDIEHVGLVSNQLLSNSDLPTRSYQALAFQTTYQPLDRLSVRADYAVQLRNHGNFVGESASRPGETSILGNYPEIFGPALSRLMPEGRLDSFQRHKLRVYTIYEQSFGRFGSVDVSPIWRVNSGRTYSLSRAIRLPAAQLARNPGYPANDINPFVRETVFFGDRGEFDFKGYGVLDLAATYRIPVWRTAAPWFKIEIYNLLNNQKQIAWDTTVSVDGSAPTDTNGIPTGYIEGPRFGQATSDDHFPQPYPGQNGGRAIRLAFGARF